MSLASSARKQGSAEKAKGWGYVKERTGANLKTNQWPTLEQFENKVTVLV